MKFWQELEQKIRGCARPITLIGDFNQVLIELPTQGMWYTWSNDRSDSNIIYELLDRVLVSSDWFEKFPNASLMVLPIQRLDYSPLVFDMDMVVQQSKCIKRFEAIWLMDDTLKHIVPRAWSV
ncbi:hypothetical protein LOK49_LG02G02515 [Camellia lanceoleosa]|uniref:Uncharacterized protein n=1 Tax=Camellia lanceoleosa TaxID=1840588 RepID=A0ACC0IQ65_9ERIC|nr:hypothetical protein LOK49_LG02G02515 [Camellia lanceoleosa]